MIQNRERDDYLRFFMQNQFDRAEVAMDLALNTYKANICTNPKNPTDEENRDIVLEILSDVRIPRNNTLFHIPLCDSFLSAYVSNQKTFSVELGKLQHFSRFNLQARYVAPLIQTGNYHSKLNPLTYMYLFSHISKAGDFPNVRRELV